MKQLLRNKMLIAAFLSLSCVVGSCLYVTQPLYAQVAGTGTIQGTVTDQSGSVIQGVSVKATNTATGLSIATTSTSAGFYVLPALQPGDYTVVFNAIGFEPLVQENVDVGPIATVGLNMTLKVGAATAEVTVTTAPPALDTENGTIDSVLPAETYSMIPVPMSNGPKSPLAFAALLPGVYNDITGAGQYYLLGGGIEGSSDVFLNGIALPDVELGGSALTLTYATNPEDVETFQAITNGIPAYYTSLGVLNVVSKSGTNQFHGDVYENIRNTVFDSPGYFSAGVVPVEHQNEYGVSAGGPILKNRVFAFFNTDRYDLTTGATPSFITVPTTAERTGDFSAFPQPLYDPSTTSCPTPTTCTRMQFPGNKITSGISDASTVLASELPAPTNSNLTSNYLASETSGLSQQQYYGRLDATINGRNHAYFLAEEAVAVQTGNTSPLPYDLGDTLPSNTNVWTLQAGETWSIKSNPVNLFGVQYNLVHPVTINSSAGTKLTAESGLTNLPPGTQDVLPAINFSGASGTLGGPYSPYDWGQDRAGTDSQGNLTFQDNIQWTKGKHSVTAGYSESFVQYDYLIDNFAAYTFTNGETAGFCPASGMSFAGTACTPGALDTTTGNPYASYLLGLVDGSNGIDSAAGTSGARFTDYSMYVQDDWKLTPRLTLNIGLRYEIPKPYYEAHYRNSWMNPTLPNPAVDGYPGALQFAGYGTNSCMCKQPYPTHYLEFDPRFGFAYALNPKTVIRGSFGVSHFLGGALGGSDDNPATGLYTAGFSSNFSYSSPDGSIKPAYTWPDMPAYALPPDFSPTLNAGFNTTTGPDGGGIDVEGPLDQAGRMPYSENWSFTIGRELSPSVVWQITYTGNASHHLPDWQGDGVTQNNIDPKYYALGPLLNAQTTDANWTTEFAAAQAIIPGIGLPYANFDGSIGQMLLPKPQYAWSADWYGDVSQAAYEALQTSVEKKMSNGLYLMASYVWAKSIDNTGAVVPQVSSLARNVYNFHEEYSVSVNDVPNAIKVLYSYRLPAGRGHLVGGQNAVTDALLGGWQVSGDNVYLGGTPLATIDGACYVPYNYGCYAS